MTPSHFCLDTAKSVQHGQHLTKTFTGRVSQIAEGVGTTSGHYSKKQTMDNEQGQAD